MVGWLVGQCVGLEGGWAEAQREVVSRSKGEFQEQMRLRGSGLGFRAGSYEDCGWGLRSSAPGPGSRGLQSGFLSLTRIMHVKVLAQRSRLHSSSSCSEMEPPPTCRDIGTRSIQLRVMELLVQGAHDHRRHIPESTAPRELPLQLSLLPDSHSRRSPTLTGLSQPQSSRVPPPGRDLPPCGSPHTP